MTFFFARMHPDGRLSGTLPQNFPTMAEAKAAAPELLVRLRTPKGQKIVLLQVLEEAQVLASVKYIIWSKKK